MIGIIDYNAGNLRSILKAVELFDKAKIIKSEEEILSSDKLILPGVGNFGSAIKNLSPVKEAIVKAIDEGVPFLGICLGLQILFEWSEEANEEGLKIIKGEVLRFRKGKVPHMGWNTVKILKDSPIFEGIKDEEYFYFVHSYYVVPREDCVVGETNYYIDFPSVIQRDNLLATQFHPEKSGKIGLRLLENFIELF
ncbi:imidazole glycerol phosphate synthase subunit HisH [Methanocaldococcus infernus]